MSSDCRLTTIDNPFDPFEQFTSWYMFDVEHKYNTCSYLARVSNISDDMSQDEIDEEHERAIDKIIELDFMNIYKKVYRNQTDTTETTTDQA